MAKLLIKLQNVVDKFNSYLKRKVESCQEKCTHPKWTTPTGPNGEMIEYRGNCPDCGKFFYCYRMF